MRTQTPPDMSEASTWPIWLVTLFVIGFIVAVVWAWIATHTANQHEKALEKHDAAWKYLAKMAPVLARRETFGEFYYRTSIGEYPRYAAEVNQSSDIDHKRIIEAGKQYDERRKYNKVYHDLKTLDKILEPLNNTREEKNDE